MAALFLTDMLGPRTLNSEVRYLVVWRAYGRPTEGRRGSSSTR